jgi:membrane protease YdiL (CAAX protease family)
MSAGCDRRERFRVVLELTIIIVLTLLYLTLFPRRPAYVDAALGLMAVTLIGLGAARSRRLWATQPAALAGRSERLMAATRGAVLFSAPITALFLIVAAFAGHANDGWAGTLERVGNWHLLLALLLYFPWALLQQFVFQFYLLGRLLCFLPPAVAVGITAAAFSVVHYPRFPIMAATLIAGVFWSLSYRRYRTLLPLAVSHALLGATMHYWVMGRDLLASWLPLP